MNLHIEIIEKQFSIEEVTGEPCEIEYAKGRITIGDHWETLYIPLDYWSIEDYEKQWKEGLKRLRFYDRSCLVVSIHNPKDCRFIEWWPLYRIRGKIYIRNEIILEKIYDKRIGNKKFTLTNCYNFVGPRTRGKGSEWIVSYQ